LGLELQVQFAIGRGPDVLERPDIGRARAYLPDDIEAVQNCGAVSKDGEDAAGFSASGHIVLAV
jgi:hypothetical protein